jgi:hypothetical protein
MVIIYNKVPNNPKTRSLFLPASVVISVKSLRLARGVVCDVVCLIADHLHNVNSVISSGVVFGYILYILSILWV